MITNWEILLLSIILALIFTALIYILLQNITEETLSLICQILLFGTLIFFLLLTIIINIKTWWVISE